MNKSEWELCFPHERITITFRLSVDACRGTPTANLDRKNACPGGS
ncbi:hypothetical protein [Halobacillus halophilus]|nr:hypothetical protein [Halobacillus halophilus]